MRHRWRSLGRRHLTRDRDVRALWPARAVPFAVAAIVAAIAAAIACAGPTRAEAGGVAGAPDNVFAGTRASWARATSSPAPASAPRPPTVANARLQKTVLHGLAAPMVVWRPDSRELACVEYMGQTIHLWDSQTGSQSGSMTERDGHITALAYSPDGSHLATVLAGDIGTPTAPTFIVWDVGARKVARRPTVPGATPPQLTASLIYSSDGSYVAISVVQSRRTILFEPSRSVVKGEVATPSNTGAMEMDPGGQALAYASHDPREGYPIKIVRMSDGATVTGDVRHAQASRSLAFDPSGRHVAVGDADGAVTLYDARSGRMVRRLERHDHDVFSVRFHPRGERLLSVSSDGLRVWDVKSGAQLRHCRLGSSAHHVFAISPDTRSVATAGRDELKLWDTCPEPANAVR